MNNNSIIIIVPYRNRDAHLEQFITHMQTYCYGIPICIVEQEQGKPFNRGRLLNIGFLENAGFSFFVFHDVDMLPLSVNYTIGIPRPVVQLASSNIQLFDYLGGVTRFSAAAFVKAGGYHNDYFHRAEDNEMMFNLKRLNMNVIRKPGQYQILEHERKGLEFDPALWDVAKKTRQIQNQLHVCKYKVIKTSKQDNIKHLLVSF